MCWSRNTPITVCPEHQRKEVRNCVRDEGGPLGVDDQELISNHHELLLLRAMVVSVVEKAGR
jgi:hypothetical protein